jgi:hypothetical protein
MSWTCQRTTDGVPCKHVNQNIHKLCRKCAKRRAARPRKARK